MKPLNQTTLGFLLTLVLAGWLATTAQGAEVFTSVGSLAIPRFDHTATLLPNGKVLVAAGHYYDYVDGNIVDHPLDIAEVYDPATRSWSFTGSLAHARESHTATLLANGKVLVAGGVLKGGYIIPLNSAELYDPVTGTWSSTGSLRLARYGHTATLLSSGKVLVVAGDHNDAELYDPATGTWSSAGILAHGRNGHTASSLSDGKVLVAGGGYSGAEIYNPATGTWSSTGGLVQDRDSHAATLLPNGKVLVAGGEYVTNGSPALILSSAELYDPVAGTWTVTGSLGAARMGPTATLLSSGQVLVVGGYNNGGPVASAELYDPATGTWSPASSLGTGRHLHSMTLLASGKVLVAGGVGLGSILGSAELYGPAPSFLNPILNPNKLGDGSFQFTFSNPSGSSYHVLAGTSLAAPLNTWSNLGSATEMPPGSGQFQFTDHQATNYPQRFYRVSSP